MSSTIIITVLFVLISAWLVAKPHLTGQNHLAPEKEGARRKSLLEEKERLIQILRDLELDHDTQKLSEEEFERMNLELRSELVTTLKKLEESAAPHGKQR